MKLQRAETRESLTSAFAYFAEIVAPSGSQSSGPICGLKRCAPLENFSPSGLEVAGCWRSTAIYLMAELTPYS